ncbi:hypothetical protein [Salinarimonas ramus]|nr:hypothetical protein [Salinarimonas ramus]
MALVRKRLDPNGRPALSSEAARRFDGIRDEDIDYSDIPDLTRVDWPKVDLDERGRIVAVRVPVDEDVVAWFRRQDPEGFERRMAEVLADHARGRRPGER